MILYSRADTWLGWGESREVDRRLHSMGRILKLSARGLRHTLVGSTSDKKRSPKGRLATTIGPMILLALLCGQTTRDAQGAQGLRVTSTPVPMGRQAGPGSFDNTFTLTDAGVPETIVLRGVDAYHTVYFSVPQDELVKTA